MRFPSQASRESFVIFPKPRNMGTHFKSVIYLVLSLAQLRLAKYTPCVPKTFGFGSQVCVCSDNYCDGFQGTPHVNNKQYVAYTSSKDGQRFHEAIEHIQLKDQEGANVVIITIDSAIRQEIIGFGGAFSDATALNLQMMTPALRSKAIESYFSSGGIQYTIGRIPMGASDFSTQVYSYDDRVNDFELRNFSLSVFDTKYKIPMIKLATKYAKQMRLFGSPWSAPGWLKKSDSMLKGGGMKGKAGDRYHKTWADYFVKFLQAYEAEGVQRLWGLTVQNEPVLGTIESIPMPHMGYQPEEERDFVKDDLGPALVASGYQDVNLMIHDDMRPLLHVWAKAILSDADARKYIKGIAVHWYLDPITPTSVLDHVHHDYPDCFMLGTEASQGGLGKPSGVALGLWDRGENYSQNIIEDLTHWVIGWTDWNMVLNMTGGPHYKGSATLDAPIISDHENGVFYKQPMFYHIGHFSKFIIPGSFQIHSQASSSTSLQFSSFLRPDGIIVIVVLNRSEQQVSFVLQASHFGRILTEIPARAIKTYLFGTKEENVML